MLLVLIPEQQTSEEALAQSLRGWRRSIAQCRSWLNGVPPVWSVAWVSPPALHHKGEAQWFTVTPGLTERLHALSDLQKTLARLQYRAQHGVEALVQLLAPDTRAQVYHHDRCRIPLKHQLAMRTQHPVNLHHRPVMGTYGTDVNGQVLLRLSTCNPEEVRGWLPGGELHGDLMALLHVFLGSHLDVRLQLCVARNLLPDARLACDKNQAVQIGRTAVLRPLSSQQNRHDIITINLGRYQRVQENIHRRESDEDGNYRW